MDHGATEERPAASRVGVVTNRRRLTVRTFAAGIALAVATGTSASPGRDTHGSTGPSLEQAGAFFRAELYAKLDGHWADAWRTLYPLHQKIAPLPVYVRCEASTPFPAPFRELVIEGVARSAVRIPGRTQLVAGVAVKVQVALDWYGPRDPVVFEHVFHLVAVEGRWTWILSQAEYAAYSNGRCSG